MKKRAFAAVVILFLAAATAQMITTAPGRISKPKNRPECAPHAICFSGEASGDHEFRLRISSTLDFVLRPSWTIMITARGPKPACDDDFSEIATTPLHAHNDRYLDASYGWTAEDEVRASPRNFHFVTSCGGSAAEIDRYQKGDFDKFGTSPMGRGRLWITDSRVSHAHDTADEKSGAIEWMKFSVEIVTP